MAPLSSLRKVLSSLSGTGTAIVCPACGTALDATASQCPDCLVDLVVECRDCGATLEEDLGDRCSSCGGTEFEVFRIE